MGATSIEYRFRFFLHAVIIMLGFWAPWCEPLHWTRMTTWLVLASSLSRAGWLSFSAATNAVLIVARIAGNGATCAIAITRDDPS